MNETSTAAPPTAGGPAGSSGGTPGTALVLIAVVVGLIAALFGFATGVGLGWTPLGTRPTVLEGTVTAASDDGWHVTVDLPDGAAEEDGFVVAGALWRERGGQWQQRPADGAPTCIEPDSSGQRIRFAAAPVRPALEAPGRRVVAWVECLDPAAADG